MNCRGPVAAELLLQSADLAFQGRLALGHVAGRQLRLHSIELLVQLGLAVAQVLQPLLEQLIAFDLKRHLPPHRVELARGIINGAHRVRDGRYDETAGFVSHPPGRCRDGFQPFDVQLKPLGLGFQAGHRAHQLAHLVQIAAEIVRIEDLVAHQVIDVAQFLVGHRFDDGLGRPERLSLRNGGLAHHGAIKVGQVARLVLEALHHLRAHTQLMLQVQVQVLQLDRRGLHVGRGTMQQVRQTQRAAHDEEQALAKRGLGSVFMGVHADQRSKGQLLLACAFRGLENQGHIAGRSLAQEHAIGLLPQRVGRQRTRLLAAPAALRRFVLTDVELHQMLVSSRQQGLDRIQQRRLARAGLAGQQNRIREGPLSALQRTPLPGDQFGDPHSSRPCADSTAVAPSPTMGTATGRAESATTVVLGVRSLARAERRADA